MQEQRRLASDEADWNLTRGLATTRTRGGGSGRPDYERMAQKKFMLEDTGGVEETSTIVDFVEEVVEDASLEDDASTAANVTPTTAKPMHTRVILEVSQLEQAFRNYPCPECGDELELKLRTVCIATYIQLVCNNKA